MIDYPCGGCDRTDDEPIYEGFCRFCWRDIDDLLTPFCATCQDRGLVFERLGDDDWEPIECPTCSVTQEVPAGDPSCR